MNDYLRACRRFWWVLLIGFAAALGVTYAVAKHHGPPTYTSSLEMMVDSPNAPFLRTGVTSVTTQPAKKQLVKIPVRSSAKSGGGTVTYKTEVVTVPQSPTIASQTPDTQVLIRAANLYPSLIQSDAVATLREKQFGFIPGTVTAQAEFATSTPTGKFIASSFPLINITAQARGEHAAKTLAWATFVAFKHWLVANQDSRGVPKNERIMVNTLIAPERVDRTTHSRVGLAAVAGAAVLAGFVFLVIVLDKLVPLRSRKRVEDGNRVEEKDEQEKVVGRPPAPVPVPPEI